MSGPTVVANTFVPAPSWISTDINYVWVGGSGFSTGVTRLSGITGAVNGFVPIGSNTSVSSDGTNCYVSGLSITPISLTQINCSTLVTSSFLISDGLIPSSFSSDGTYIWITCNDQPIILRITCTTVTAQIPCPQPLSHLGGAHTSGIVSFGSYVWYANWGDSTITQLYNSGTNCGDTVGAPITITAFIPFFLSVDTKYVWCVGAVNGGTYSSSNLVLRMRYDDNSYTQTIFTIGSLPTGAVSYISTDGTNAWVSLINNDVIQINCETGAQNIISLGTDLTLETIASNGHNVFVSAFSNAVYNIQIDPPSVCFNEDTKILCLNSDYKEINMPIQDIEKGTLVKTLKHGYLPVDTIRYKTLNSKLSKLKMNNMFKLSTEKYDDLTEDLYITGSHNILVNELTNDERKETLNILNKIYVTDGKYRLLAAVDKRAEMVEGTFTIYHFALENESEYSNYGIYANGLLVESCSKRMLNKISNMVEINNMVEIDNIIDNIIE